MLRLHTAHSTLCPLLAKLFKRCKQWSHGELTHLILLLSLLQKFKQDPGALCATATATIERNGSNRLRIQHIDVAIQLGVAGADLAHLDRALAQFEEFCTVSMSVRQGIDIAVSVTDTSGAKLK